MAEGMTRRRRSVYSHMDRLMRWAETDNLAESELGDDLEWIGRKVVTTTEIDDESRADWRLTAEKALDMARQKKEPKNFPFEQASNIAYPLLTTAALQFGARSYPAIVDGKRIVKAQVLGSDGDGAKRSKAARVSEHMSWQLLEQMPEWEGDTDTILHHIPIVGCAFRKVYWDAVNGRPCSEMISALDCIVNNNARNLETAPRITHRFERYPYELRESMANEVYRECDLSLEATSEDDQEPHELLEQHCMMDLDDDGLDEPYIVTVHKATQQVLRVRANYSAASLTFGDRRLRQIRRQGYFVKYPFLPDPEGGFYDIGFGRLLESVSGTIDTILNQMIDAGTLQNAGGGFIGSGLRMKKGVFRQELGVWHMVQSSGDDIRRSIVPMQHPGPSDVLFKLLGTLLEAGKEITSIKDILTGDLPRNQTATTTLAMIEQGLKVFVAIHKRLFRALRQEYRLLFRLNAEHMDATEQVYAQVLDDEKAIAKQDYDMQALDVAPVADPNLVTDAQKMGRAQLLMELSQLPQINGGEALLRVLEAAGIEDVEKIVVQPQPDPMQQAVTELQVRGAAADVATKEATAVKTGAEAELVAEQARVAEATRDAEGFAKQIPVELREFHDGETG